MCVKRIFEALGVCVCVCCECSRRYVCDANAQSCMCDVNIQSHVTRCSRMCM